MRNRLLVLACASTFVAARGAPVERTDEPLSSAKKHAEAGRADLLVAALAASDSKADDERLWAPAVVLGHGALKRAELRHEREPRGPALCTTFAEYQKGLNPELVRAADRYTRAKVNGKGQLVCAHQVAVLARAVDAEHSLHGLIIAPGNVSATVGITDSLVLTNGSVASPGVLCSVLICDGDVRLKGARRSLIVARGNIEIEEADACALVASGKVSVKKVPTPPMQQQVPFGDPEGFSIFQLQVAIFETTQKVWWEDKNANPLKFITFFELHRVGIEAKVEGGALVLSAVKGDSVAGRAGLKAGDVVLSAGGAKPTDAEALRRALRDALAVGDAKVQVRRAGTIAEAKFGLPE